MENCSICGKQTVEFDQTYQLPICSDRCRNKAAVQQKVNTANQYIQNHIDQFRNEINYELWCTHNYKSASKDIVIIVHNQLEYLKQCIDSIKANTENYTIHIWDNGSNQETKEYIEACGAKYVRVEENIGFIKPNNELLKQCTSDYVILLNSDTRVLPNWANSMIGFLQANPNTKQIGYMGVKLDEDGQGRRADLGYNIDYVCGWCSCFPRSLYNEIGLFDEGLQFAYFEDSDFSLRVQQAGYKIYALHTMLVHHYENKTIKEVHKENKINVAASFKHNNEYFLNKWSHYLKHERLDKR